MGTNEDVERITNPDHRALKEEDGHSEMKYHVRTKSSAHISLALRAAVWVSLLMIIMMQGVEAVESQAVHSSSSSLNSVNRSFFRVMGIVACGSFGGCTRNQDAVNRNDKDDKAGVRCCSDKRKDGWEKKAKCEIWATTPSFPCYPDATFADAFDICSLNGNRLCTATEVYENCTKGTGCGLDNKLIWTSSTNFHTENPSWSPSSKPSTSPSPSVSPSLSSKPSSSPNPSSGPSQQPSNIESPHPSSSPSKQPTKSPTKQPTYSPTLCTENPTAVFFLKNNVEDLSEEFQSCNWLRNKNTARTITQICKNREASKKGRAPARIVCKDTCKMCIPSEHPSSIPSLTLMPSSRPFIGATRKPSITKSNSPTSMPSEVTDNPSSSPINSLKIVGSDRLATELILANNCNIRPGAWGEFEKVLGARVKRQLDDQFDDSFEVDAAVISTEISRSRGRTRNLQADRRFLQDTGLDVVTELTTRTRSNKIYTSDAITKAALRAFDSDIELQNFLSELKSSDSSFDCEFSLAVKEVPNSEDVSRSGLSTWGTAGISLGSAAVIFGAFLVATFCRKRDKGLGHLPVSSVDNDVSSVVNTSDIIFPVAVEPSVTSPMKMMLEPSIDNGSSPRNSNPYKLHQQHLDISSMQSSAYDDGSSRTGDSGFTSEHRSDFNSEMSSRADNIRNYSSTYTRSMYDSRSGGVYDSRSGSISDSSVNKRHDKNHLNARDMPATILEQNGGLSIASSGASRSNKKASEKDASRSKRSASRSRSRSSRRRHSRDGESRGSSSRRSRSTGLSDIKDNSSSKRSRSTGRLERSDAHAIGSSSPSRRRRSRSSGRGGTRNGTPRERSRSSGRGDTQDGSSRVTSRRRSQSSGRHDTRGSTSRNTPRNRARSSGRADTGDSTSHNTSTTRARSVGPSDARGASRSSSRRRTRSSERSKTSHSSERNERNSSRTRSSGRSNTRDITLLGKSTQRSSFRTRDRSSGRSSARSTAQTSGRSSSMSRKSGEESRRQRSRSKSRSKKVKSIEIIVTPGKLGFIIDAPLDGHPVVHLVKETSILGDRIMVGDKLISIDGQEMLGLTSKEISKIIKDKANNPKRVMVFQRPPRQKAENMVVGGGW